MSSGLLQQSAAAAPYVGGGVSSHAPPPRPWTWGSSSPPSCAPQQPILGGGVAPLWRGPWAPGWGSSSWPPLLRCRSLQCVRNRFNHILLFATLWITARQTPLSVGSSKQEYWCGLPRPPPGHLPHPGIEPLSLTSLLHWQVGSFPQLPHFSKLTGKIFNSWPPWKRPYLK